MIGIPIYSADPSIHDYVVQAEGAFDETVRGILNLKRFRQKVEIRVVLHKQTYKGLPHRRNVKWMAKHVEREAMSDMLKKSTGSIHHAFCFESQLTHWF